MADGLYEIQQIIGRRVTTSGKEEYLVHWKNYDYLNRTWEPLENLTSCLNTVANFLSKAFPMPGVTASEVVHLKAKSHSQVRRNMPVTDIDKRKLKRLLGNKDLVHEILKEKSKNLSEKKSGRRGQKRKLSERVLNDGQKEQHETALNGRRMLRSGKDAGPTFVEHRRRQSSWGGSKKLARLIQNSIHLSQAQGVRETPAAEKPTDRPTRTTRIQGEMAEGVSLTKEGKVWKVTLCNEKKCNVLTVQMCEQLSNMLHEAAKEDVNVIVLSGAGDCFCGGLDYSFLINNPHYKAAAKLMTEKFEHLVQMFIMCSTPIVAAVNGNAFGFGAALLGLCDVVYSTHKATFQFGFTKWGHPPIGCTSFLLERLLGKTGACSMLLLNNTMGAAEAWENGLVMETLKGGNFMEQVNDRLKGMTSGIGKVLEDTKTLLRQNDQETLAQVNRKECKMLVKYLSDEQFVTSLETTWKKDILN